MVGVLSSVPAGRGLALPSQGNERLECWLGGEAGVANASRGPSDSTSDPRRRAHPLSTVFRNLRALLDAHVKRPGVQWGFYIRDRALSRADVINGASVMQGTS